MKILAGNVGGTKTRLALFELEGGLLNPVAVEIFPSRECKSLDLIVRSFLEKHKPLVEHACFGIAGPVKSRRSETPNLVWLVDALQLATELGIKNVELINDLEASAYGIALLEPKDSVVLNEGVPDRRGDVALISADTGLGEAGLHWEGDHYQPFPSEGGHVDFGPRNELEVELFLYLLKQYGHVSFERVLSAPGLFNVYKFLRDTGRG